MSNGVYIALLAVVHLLAGRIRIESFFRRAVWLSVAGGITIAYVFVHLLPEVAELNRKPSSEINLYQISLFGVLLFYGLEKLAKSSRKNRNDKIADSTGVFWIHIGSFAIYNAIIGYTFASDSETSFAAFTFFVAMAVHFYANDHALWNHYQKKYDQAGRWFLGAGVTAGWLLGIAEVLPESGIAIATALLVGAIILNALKDELPEERESNYWALALSAAAYASLLVLTE